ncbi:MAG TPA: hypothetical protein VJH97_02670 [Candidatus Nanoarchaeia archaeon]|nr:hypothetical protein [Candidatus Nanoarchaeia archaeon]
MRVGEETNQYEDSVQYVLSPHGRVVTISPNLNSSSRQRKKGQLTKSLYESMPVGTQLRLLRRKHDDELSDLVNLKAVSQERLMALRPLQTDEEVAHYEAVRPIDDREMDPHLMRRLEQMGVYHPGVKVMDFIVLYSTTGRNAGPMNRAAEEICLEGSGNVEVIPFDAYKRRFEQALRSLEAERTREADEKKVEPQRASVGLHGIRETLCSDGYFYRAP